MGCLCWNTSRHGNPRGVQTLCNLLAKEDLDLVFLQETKVRASFITFRMRNFGFQNRLVVDCVGNSGCLVILWENEVDFEVINFSTHHVHHVIKMVNENNQQVSWLMTGVYGHLEVSQRKEVWNLVQSLRF